MSSIPPPNTTYYPTPVHGTTVEQSSNKEEEEGKEGTSTLSRSNVAIKSDDDNDEYEKSSILGRTLARLRTLHETDWPRRNSNNIILDPNNSRVFTQTKNSNVGSSSRSNENNQAADIRSRTSMELNPPMLNSSDTNIVPEESTVSVSVSSSTSVLSPSSKIFHPPAPILTSPRPDQSLSSSSSSYRTTTTLEPSRLTASSIMNNLAQHTRRRMDNGLVPTTMVQQPTFLPPAVLSSAPPNTVLQAVGSYLIPLPLPGINNVPTQSLLLDIPNNLYSLAVKNSRGSRRSPLVSSRSLFTIAQGGIGIRNTEEEETANGQVKYISFNGSDDNNNNNENKKEDVAIHSTATEIRKRSRGSPSGKEEKINSSASPSLLLSPRQQQPNKLNMSIVSPPLTTSKPKIPLPSSPVPSSPTLLRSLLHRPTASLIASSANYPPSIQYRSSLDIGTVKPVTNTVALSTSAVLRSQSSPPRNASYRSDFVNHNAEKASQLPTEESVTLVHSPNNNYNTVIKNEESIVTNYSPNGNNRFKRFTRIGRSISPSSPQSPRVKSSPRPTKVDIPNTISNNNTTVVYSPEPLPRGQIPQPSINIPKPLTRTMIIPSANNVRYKSLSPVGTNRASQRTAVSPSRVHWDEVLHSSINRRNDSNVMEITNHRKDKNTSSPSVLASTLPLDKPVHGVVSSSSGSLSTKNNHKFSDENQKRTDHLSHQAIGTIAPKSTQSTVNRSSSAFEPGRYSAIRVATRATLPKKETSTAVQTKVNPPPVPKEASSSQAMPKLNRSKVYAHVRSSGYGNAMQQTNTNDKTRKTTVPKETLNRTESTVPPPPPPPVPVSNEPVRNSTGNPSSSSAVYLPLSPPSSPLPLSEDEQQLQDELRNKLTILKQDGRVLQSQLSEAKINQETAMADAAIARVEYEESKARVSTLSRERDAYKLRFQAAKAVLEEQNKHSTQEELTYSTVQGIKLASLQTRIKRLQNEYTEIQHHIECLQNEVIPELELDKVRTQNKQEECLFLRKSVTLLQQGKLVNAPKQTRVQIRITQKKNEDEIRQLINDIDQLVKKREQVEAEVVPLRNETCFHQNRFEQLRNENRELYEQLNDTQRKRTILREKGYITTPVTLGLPIRDTHNNEKSGYLPTVEELQSFLTAVQENQPQKGMNRNDDNSNNHADGANTYGKIDDNNDTMNNSTTLDNISVEESLVTIIKDTKTQTILQPPPPKLSGAALVRSVLADSHISSLLASPATRKKLGNNRPTLLNNVKPPTIPLPVIESHNKSSSSSNSVVVPVVVHTDITRVSDRLLSALAMADKAINTAKLTNTITTT